MLHSYQYFSTFGSMTAPGSITSQAWKDLLLTKNIHTRKYLINNELLMDVSCI
jgi:hypothetical protein